MMDIERIFGMAGAVLLSVGGGGAIVAAFASWLGKLWAERLMKKEEAEHQAVLAKIRSDFEAELESYKVRLKKSEFVFQKEYAAACEFVELVDRFLPFHQHPDMEESEKWERIARKFTDVEKAMRSYLACNGAILLDEVRMVISEACGVAAVHKFDAPDPLQPAPPGLADAGKKWEDLVQKATKMLLERVRSQTAE